MSAPDIVYMPAVEMATAIRGKKAFSGGVNGCRLLIPSTSLGNLWPRYTADGRKTVYRVGLQIVGCRFADATVLEVAAAFEQAAPRADKYPPLD